MMLEFRGGQSGTVSEKCGEGKTTQETTSNKHITNSMSAEDLTITTTFR
jgi:hypothetical protein